MILVVIGLGLSLGLLTACGPTEAGARAELEKRIEVMGTAARDVLHAMDALQLPDASARGRLESCGGSLRPGVYYLAGASATIGDDWAAAVEGMTKELEKAGWEYVGEIGGDDPTARFTRGEVTVDLKTGGFTNGGTLYGADQLEVGIRDAGSCVHIPDGVSDSDFADLEGAILP